MSEDTDLLARWHAGDNRAGHALFKQHYPAMVRFFRNKVDDAARDDLIQQTFIAASTAQFDGRVAVRTFFFGIAWNKLRLHFRAAARRARLEANPDRLSMADLAMSPETSLVAKQESRLLLEA